MWFKYHGSIVKNEEEIEDETIEFSLGSWNGGGPQVFYVIKSTTQTHC